MRNKCVIEGCDSWVKARGWCNKHYYQWYRSEGSGLRKHSMPNEFQKAQWLERRPSIHAEKGRSPDPVCGGDLVPVVCGEIERSGRRKTGLTLLYVRCDRCGLKGEPVALDK